MRDRLYELRKELNLSQEKFAKTIGVSKTTISEVESGRIELSDKHIRLICGVFNVNESWLRNGDGNMFSISPLAQEANRLFEEMDDDMKIVALNVLKALVESSRKK